MKKILFYSMMLLTSCAFFSCSDKDDANSEDLNRMNMTMFRIEENTGISSDPYASQIVNLNTAELRWYTVEGAYGYRIKWASQNKVSGGQDAWEETEENGELAGDTIILGEKSDFLSIEHLNYQTDYRFAIQVLAQPGSGKENSKWYGYGNGREWAEYLGLTTSARYEVPSIIQKSNVDYTSFRVNLNRSTSGYTADQMTGFEDYGFTSENGVFRVDYLRIQASASTPNANVPAKYAKYVISDQEWAQGYVDIEGLDSNSVYVIDVVRTDIPYSVDNTYNSLSARTKGTPGPAIYVEHVVSDTTIYDSNDNESYTPAIFQQYQAMRLDGIIEDYMASLTLAENQVFYLEGGKRYVCTTNLSLYKGLTLATNPEDIAAGKGQAIISLGGLSRPAGSCNSTNFMFGRQPESGENSTIPIDVDTIRFENITFDCPTTITYGEQQAITGTASPTGNYLANMYSNGMGVNINMFHLKGCTFKQQTRGFIRTQGSNQKIFHNILIEDCEMYDGGYYSNAGSDYNWIHGQGTQTSSNVFENVVWRNNTFYDSPKGSLVTNGGEHLAFDADVQYNITIENNTFINFQTRGSGSAFMGIRYVPAGSTFTIKKNLFVLTKRDGDTSRGLYFIATDMRAAQGGDGTAQVTVDMSDNYSTSDNITSSTGQICTSYPFNHSSRGFGKFATLSAEQTEELKIHPDDITAAELMVQPNPPYDYTDLQWAHHATCIDGSQSGTGMVNLYFQNTDKVRNSVIYTKGIGASKWREGIGTNASKRARR